MNGTIEDKVLSEPVLAGHEAENSCQTNYPNTRFTRAAGRFCDFMDRYIGGSFVKAIEYCLDYLSDVSVKTRLNIVRYYDKHGNIVDKHGQIVDLTNVTLINQGKKYKDIKNKEKLIKKL